MPRYPRYLSDDFLRLLVPGGPLDFLIAACLESAVPDRYAVDVQIRSGNALQYYHGTTSLLRIAFDGTCLQAHAAERYRRLPGFDQLFTPCSLGSAELKELRRLLPDYLAAAAPAADPRYCGANTAGYWRNCLSICLGREWRPGLDWLVIDREACVEFESRVARQALLGPHRATLLAACWQLGTVVPSIQDSPATTNTIGYVLDLLVLGPRGELVCVNLGDESNARGLHLGQLRACACRDDFRLAVDHIATDLERVVRQKALLGLLPLEAASRLPPTKLRRVECALVLVTANDESPCGDRLRDMMARHHEVAMPVIQVRSCADLGRQLRNGTSSDPTMPAATPAVVS